MNILRAHLRLARHTNRLDQAREDLRQIGPEARDQAITGALKALQPFPVIYSIAARLMLLGLNEITHMEVRSKTPYS